MKTLTIRQPWAWLIVHGYKTVENRSWRTTHRGPLLIHAAQTIDREGMRWAIEEASANGAPLSQSDLQEIRRVGVVIGVVDIIDCTRAPRGADQLWYKAGMWAWVLRNPHAIEPIPAVGKLGLFDLIIPSLSPLPTR